MVHRMDLLSSPIRHTPMKVSQGELIEVACAKTGDGGFAVSLLVEINADITASDGHGSNSSRVNISHTLALLGDEHRCTHGKFCSNICATNVVPVAICHRHQGRRGAVGASSNMGLGRAPSRLCYPSHHLPK